PGPAVRGDHRVHGPAPEVLGARVVDGAVPIDVVEVVDAVRRAERSPGPEAVVAAPAEAGPVAARPRERRRRRGSVALAVRVVLEPVLLGEAARAVEDPLRILGREPCDRGHPALEGGGDEL